MLAIRSRSCRALCFVLALILSFTFLCADYHGAYFFGHIHVAYALEEEEPMEAEEEKDTGQSQNNGGAAGQNQPQKTSDPCLPETSEIPSEEETTSDPNAQLIESQNSAEFQEQVAGTLLAFRNLEVGSTLPAIPLETMGDILEAQGEPEEEDPLAYTNITDNSDGSHTAEIYFAPIKYKDENGSWKTINQLLQKKIVQGKIVFETVSSPIDIQFAGSSSGKLATISKDGYQISFAPATQAQPQSSAANHALVPPETGELPPLQSVKTNAEVKLQGDAREIAASNASLNEEFLTITFEKILNNRQDIVLQPSAYGVKEDIVLHSLPAQTRFSFEFSFGKLYPVLLEDGNVWLMDRETDEIVAAIPAPNMIDSSAEERESYDIDVEMIKLAEGKYQYILTPNRQWLEDAERVYPIIIDPSVTFTTSTMLDTFVTSKYYNNNYANDANVKIGNSGDLAVSRGFFKTTDLASSIGSGKSITNAVFTAYQNYSGASTVDVGIYQISTMYDNSIVTWKTQPSLVDSSTYACKATVSAVGSYSWNITTMVKSWYSGARVSGFCLRNVDEGPNKYKRFSSAQHGTASQRPKLVVTYVDPPTAPSSVTLSPTSWTAGNITVSWGSISQSAGATLTEVQYSTTSATSGFAKIDSPSKLSGGSATLSLPDGAKYVWIRGKNSLGQVGAATRSNAQYKRDRTGPAIPNTLTGTPAFSSSAGSITANWSASTDGGCGLDHYEVTLKKNSEPWTTYLDVGNKLTHTFTGLSDQATYQLAVRAFDKLGNRSSWKYSSAITIGDYTPPTAPEAVSISPQGWTNNLSPTISWTGITDTNLQKAQYQIDSGAWMDIPTASGMASGSYVIPSAQTQDLTDGEHTIAVRGIDSAGMAGAAKSVQYQKDTVAPLASISISGSQPIVGRIPVCGTISNEENRADFASWTLKYGLGTGVAEDNLVTLATGTGLSSDEPLFYWDISGLTEEENYTVCLFAEDEAGNVTSSSATFYKSVDSLEVGPVLTIASPRADTTITDANTEFTFNYVDTEQQNAILSSGKLVVNGVQAATQTGGEKSISFDASAWDAQTGKWVYAEGQTVFLFVQGKDENGNAVYSYPTYKKLGLESTLTSLDQLLEGVGVACTPEGMTLAAQDGGYTSSGSAICLETEYTGNANYIDLIVEETVPEGTGIAYEVSVDSGINWSPIQPVSRDGGQTMSLVNRRYLTGVSGGSSVRIRAALSTVDTNISPTLSYVGMDVRFVTYSTAVVVDNGFEENARGFTALSNTIHDETAGVITLKAGQSEGSVQSTVRTLPSDATQAVLQVTQEIPAGAQIGYYLSTDGGLTFQQLQPGDPNISSDWTALSSPGDQIVLKAVLESADGAAPALLNWRLSVKTMASGQPYVVKLVDEPTNLSTLSGANYQTLLRWKPSETAGVTYNIYRSETPYFVPSEATLVASGIEEASWSDYNLNFSKTFYYQVTAVATINGHERESLPSNQAWATVVDRDEVQKRLGLQNYWGYAGFKTGGGEGYVNVSNGNLSYISTDMVVSDPFFAMVMRRTYNSMATTKTPLGYGWDFSFNTCLLREFDETGESEVGMILKDGDGSFHRFALQSDGTYASAKGTFMKLYYDETADEYTITRKDNIVYHFDAQSMKLKSFTNPNGNALIFSYDERGNLSEVCNTVGDKMLIEYSPPQARTPLSEDYIYINEQVDMVAKITWRENSDAQDAQEVVYHYTYDEDDRLARAYTAIEGNNEYGESFAYEAGSQGRLASITNPEGNVYQLEYSSGRLSKVTDPIQDTFSFLYGTNYTSVTDKYGLTNQYDYNSQGLVSRKTDALGHEVNYTYNDGFLVTGVSYQNTVGAGLAHISYAYGYDAQGNLLSISGPNGSQTLYEDYNAFGGPARMKVKRDSSNWLITSYTYDDAGNLLSTIDPGGKTTTNTYATRNGQPGYLVSITDRNGKVTEYTYNSKGQVTAVAEKFNGKALTTGYCYDALGRAISTTDPMGNETSFAYNKLGFRIGVTYANDTETSTTYSLIGNTNSVTDARGNTTTYHYDSVGRLTGASYPDGSANSVSYEKWDSDGDGSAEADKVTKTDGMGRSSIEYYDKGGRLKKKTAGGVTVHYEYDQIGNMVKITDGAGRVQQAEYNALGQNVKVISDPGGKNIQQTFTYDLLGNKLSQTDGRGNTTNYSYDNLSRLISVSQTVAGQTLVTSYGYDISSGEYIKNTVTDANGHVDETILDKGGRKVSEGSCSGNESISTQYEYNANGAVSLITRNDGSKVKYAYDAMGRTSRVDYYGAGADTSVDSGYYLSYQYDGNGNLLEEQVTQDGQTEITAYAYDSMNRMIQITQGKESVGALPVTYTYNSADQIVSASYPKEDNQSGVAAQGIGMQTLSYTYDSYGRVTGIQLGTQNVREYGYTSGGDLDYVKDYRDFARAGTGYVQAKYTYDSVGAVAKITYHDYAGPEAAGVKKEEYTLTYDNNGNILSEMAYTNYDSAKTVNKSYVYDAIGRLTSATIDGKTTSYTYDAVGNRLTQTAEGKTSTYTYNYLDQLLSINQDGMVIASYTYDDLGNQTKEEIQHVSVTVGGVATGYNKTTDYTYDLRSQLRGTTVKTPQANETTGEVTFQTETTINRYSAAGKRIERVEDNKTTRFYYMGEALLYTTDEGRVLQTENILELNGSIVASKRFEQPDTAQSNPYANQYYFYHYDARGSVTSILNRDGSPVKGYAYDEFGKTEQSGDNAFENEVTFAGSVADLSSGLQYMNARYYQASTGRFLSQDSYTGNAYDPWTQHLYIYCGNNPTSMIDPTGFASAYSPFSSRYNPYKRSGKDLHGTTSIGSIVAAGMAIVNLPKTIDYTYGYRYIGESEYQTILETGKIPNVTGKGDSKIVYSSPNKYNTVAEAESALQIGTQDPRGKFESPKYRVRYKFKDVGKITTIRRVAGGKGIEILSQDEIPVDVDDIRKLSTDPDRFVASDDQDDDHKNGNQPRGKSKPVGLTFQLYQEDEYGQRSDIDMSVIIMPGGKGAYVAGMNPVISYHPQYAFSWGGWGVVPVV